MKIRSAENLTEDEKKEESSAAENNDLKVVMPEANRVEMPPHQFKDEPDYLKNFANFYIEKFNGSDLEIIQLYDKHQNMIDINDYLSNNIKFTRKELVKHVLDIHDYNFKSLLDEMTKETGVDPKAMKTFEDWDKWYTKQRSKVQRALS